MKIYTDLYKAQDFDTAGYISIGYFDSVHLGHQKILKELVEYSNEKKLHNFVLTFKNLPKKDKDNRSVLELKNRIEIIKSLGVKNMILCEFNPLVAALTPEEFIKLIKKNFNISGFVVGKDFKFGNNKSGDISTLKNLGLEVRVVDHYPEVQIALLTERIKYLTGHFKDHPKDFHSRRGLLMLVGRRRRFLDYLKKINVESYRKIITTLGIRK
jgi:small subunit ribosomal protein S15